MNRTEILCTEAATAMTAGVASVLTTTPLREAEALLRERGVSAVAVVDTHGMLVGVLSITDLLRVGRTDRSGGQRHVLELPEAEVTTAMQDKPVVIGPRDTITDAAMRMVDRHIHRVFVVENDRPVGVISTRDLMRFVVELRLETPLEKLMSHPVLAIDASCTIREACEELRRSHVRGVAVVESEHPVGVFTQFEALMARGAPDDAKVDTVMSAETICLPVSLPIHRAAAYAMSLRARRVFAVEHRELRGILTGFDIARVLARSPHHA